MEASSSSSLRSFAKSALSFRRSSIMVGFRLMQAREKESFRRGSFSSDEARYRISFRRGIRRAFYFKIIRASFRVFKILKKCALIFFGNGLSGVRLPVVGSLVIFVFVCWCSRVPTHYAMSVTVNGR